MTLQGWGRAARTSCMSPGPQALHPYTPSLQEIGQAGWIWHCRPCHLPVCLWDMSSSCLKAEAGEDSSSPAPGQVLPATICP